ncbi:uracil-DNA glycosylase [Deinococcus planocerae]|uniref:uracil-DNA glycosylase n=1 Tax=Deinococcus planocerae TaxID=1737569 RepID=UPI000C7F4A7F|nr:uracil-DNA glycosylase [Deinococcus planocerae]
MQTRSLGFPDVLRARLDQRLAPHVAPLNGWVDVLSAERWTPSLDPADGGVGARVLLLLESPGPTASLTGFVSLDNPNATAENLTCLLHLAGLPRRQVAVWNAVPWQMSAGGVVAPVRAQYAEAAPLTRHLLSLLPELRAVVLVGRHAQSAWPHVGSPLPTFACPHPSPQNFHTRRDEAGKALLALLDARRAARTPATGQ